MKLCKDCNYKSGRYCTYKGKKVTSLTSGVAYTVSKRECRDERKYGAALARVLNKCGKEGRFFKS